ncbi:MFS transporter [Burkholderia ubonensis]|uniref:MFS transporter n=1 Tax=Burkholderia ubonensis TaxID=101571 RepID=UPI0008FDB36E|nr:MFS transporter [Burkholderia ubonensis]OJA75264.1 MFS transporter [Burkholderia ubonensis]
MSQSSPAPAAPRAAVRLPAAATLAVASATCSLIVLDTNVVAVSLPSIARSFHASFADIEWVVSAYMTAFAACLLPAGGLADRFGRKRMLAAGLAIFFVASLGCGLAPSAGWLIAARAVKGGGAALLLTAALAVIANRFPEGRERTRAWAVWGMCMGVATAVAPLVGGAITQWIGWRWVFLLNLPACALLAAGARVAIDESRDPHAKRWQARPMIDLALFRAPRFVGAVLAMFGYAACAQVMMTFLPLYLQNAFGMSAIDAGLGMLPFAFAMIVGPSFGAALAARVSSGGVLAGGLALIGAGNLLTAALTASGDYRLVALGMFVTGCGAGIMNGDTQKAIMACVPPHRTGMASGISTTTRFSAIVTAVGVLGAVLAARAHAQLDRLVAATPGLGRVVDAPFMSSLLAGDLARALERVPPQAAKTLAAAAPAAFASGFADALELSGMLALVGAVVVMKLLAQPMRQG